MTPSHPLLASPLAARLASPTPTTLRSGSRSFLDGVRSKYRPLSARSRALGETEGKRRLSSSRTGGQRVCEEDAKTEAGQREADAVNGERELGDDAG